MQLHYFWLLPLLSYFLAGGMAKDEKQENLSIQGHIWTGNKWWIIIWPLDWFACQEHIKETLGKARSYKTYRLEFFCDRRDRRSGKKFYSCVNFARKQCVFFQNLYRNRKFTLLLDKFTHTFSVKLLKFYIFISISTTISTKKDQDQLKKNLGCFFVSKNSRNLSVFSV